VNENANTEGEDTDLSEETEGDSDQLKKVRKLLREAKAREKALDAENSDFRETRLKQRVDAITLAVNDKGYPQSLVDSIISKVQDSTEEEYSEILVELQGVKPPEEAASEGAKAEEVKDPKADPATLGQELAAAASGGSAVSEIDRIMAAESVDEVNAVAAELGLGDV